MRDSSTILLVDDEDSVQKLLTYPLERDGFRVVQARDGEQALRLFGDEPVDLVVLDLMLPKLDGLEVCKRLRIGLAQLRCKLLDLLSQIHHSSFFKFQIFKQNKHHEASLFLLMENWKG